jgi:hypothetical protein
VVPDQRELVRADLREREAGQVERRRAAADVEAGGSADGCVGGEDDILEHVLLIDAGVDDRTRGIHAGAGDAELLGAVVGVIGGGIATEIERAAGLECHAPPGRRTQRGIRADASGAAGDGRRASVRCSRR